MEGKESKEEQILLVEVSLENVNNKIGTISLIKSIFNNCKVIEYKDNDLVEVESLVSREETVNNINKVAKSLDKILKYNFFHLDGDDDIVYDEENEKKTTNVIIDEITPEDDNLITTVIKTFIKDSIRSNINNLNIVIEEDTINVAKEFVRESISKNIYNWNAVMSDNNIPLYLQEELYIKNDGRIPYENEDDVINSMLKIIRDTC